MSFIIISFVLLSLLNLSDSKVPQEPDDLDWQDVDDAAPTLPPRRVPAATRAPPRAPPRVTQRYYPPPRPTRPPLRPTTVYYYPPAVTQTPPQVPFQPAPNVNRNIPVTSPPVYQPPQGSFRQVPNQNQQFFNTPPPNINFNQNNPVTSPPVYSTCCFNTPQPPVQYYAPLQPQPQTQGQYYYQQPGNNQNYYQNPSYSLPVYPDLGQIGSLNSQVLGQASSLLSSLG